jgi:hypothetical protein
MAGCKKLEDINHDPTKPTTTEPQYLLTGAEKSAMDILYAGPQNGRTAMAYAQYWTGNDKANDARYLLDEGINAPIWNNLYSVSLHNLNEIIRLNKEKPLPVSGNQIAIAQILKAWIYQVLADTYGNIPYSDALKDVNNLRPKYDDAKGIYNALIDTLTQQAAAIDLAQSSYPTGDVIFKGDVSLWKKLAHSLLLRLAIRMVDADPAKAKSVIEANWQGAMASNADGAVFTYLTAAPNKFPYNVYPGRLHGRCGRSPFASVCPSNEIRHRLPRTGLWYIRKQSWPPAAFRLFLSGYQDLCRRHGRYPHDLSGSRIHTG